MRFNYCLFKLHIKYLFSCISPYAIINIHLNVILFLLLFTSPSLISSPKFDYIQRNFLFSIRILLCLYHSISHGLSRVSLHKEMWFVIWANVYNVIKGIKKRWKFFFLRWNIRASIEIKYTVLDFICNLKNPTTTFQRIHHALPRIYCRLK